ncbi:hypothetical protein [Pedobacter xixiisoli]|uniref:Uncharacterized protein n=1 Tax=Pedobacter xixiisoli TaxID=1476464 RepID=A0A286ADA1_9SPHI|nr:hypothetical protein [Pedobacter xixiisoli]SOD19884.1 hypothetical protein SAMN06297358_3591 [Pedobacter xixiisoli]
MRDLNKQEMMEISGGGVGKKVRSGHDGVLEMMGSAIGGLSGWISGLFN